MAARTRAIGWWGVRTGRVLTAALLILSNAFYPAVAQAPVRAPDSGDNHPLEQVEWSPLFAASLSEGKTGLDETGPLDEGLQGSGCACADSQVTSDYLPQFTIAPCNIPTTGTTCSNTCAPCSIPTIDTATCSGQATCSGFHTCAGSVTCGVTCTPCTTVDTATCFSSATCGTTCVGLSTCAGTPTCGSTCSTTCGTNTCSATCDTTCGDCAEPPPPDEEIPEAPYVVGDTTFWPLYGPDRYQTAVAISQKGWDSAKTVVIATGRNWPDALGGAGLAGALGAPILLTDTNDVPDVTMGEIARLGVEKAIILGGEVAVGPGVWAELADVLGSSAIERIGGANRYETAERVAEAIVELDVGPLVFSDDMTDLSNWRTTDHAVNPWTLSAEEYVSPPTSAAHLGYVNDEMSFLDQAVPLDLSHAVVPELRASVWYNVEQDYDFLGIRVSADGGNEWVGLAEYSGTSEGFEQITVDLADFAGKPSVLISFEFRSDGSNDSNDGFDGVRVDDVSVVDPGRELAGSVAFVATGTNFPDALAAAPIAATGALPLLLVRQSGPAPVGLLQSLGVERVIILGGTTVVSPAQEAELATAFGSANVERLAGTSRYGTAAEAASWGTEIGICQWNGVALATGERFPDALTGGAMQARYASVMLLTKSLSLPSETADALTEHRGSIDWMSFLGGSRAISIDVRNRVEDILAE